MRQLATVCVCVFVATANWAWQPDLMLILSAHTPNFPQAVTVRAGGEGGGLVCGGLWG